MLTSKRRSIIESLYKTAQEVTTTYSTVMRELRKNSPEKVKPFMKAFKKAFDQANFEKLDDIESVSLLEAMQHIDYNRMTDDS